ncbi:MAG: phage Gp37/Gp68 family protein [Roseburia sp.]|nr:phage Gp37/Gp68 family protein [Roseburia sp.]
MQNEQIEKAIAWNPWHGCKRASAGCKNCFVYKMDARYGRDTSVITKGKTTYELKDKDVPHGSLIKLCFSSDFFIEEADEWRDGCWDFIRRRSDCIFVTTTKRPERIKQCLPPDWDNGWDWVHISISIENQEMADKRLPHFLEAPLAHREVFCSPLIAPMTLGKYLDTGLIKCVNVGGEWASKDVVRPLDWEWVKNLYVEAKQRGIEFYFHQSGSCFMRNGVNIGKWNLKEQIALAEQIQHELEKNF